eukprot:TRINITY_DN4158_c0_g1_i2.p1 TRINITY_DN4158_c0_g1~~TRINITY_DN4158_c0_g1_i2.p1  ORF type:complete len:1789 (+),score=447.39 TRINITY_DN4158_c0_g1_i2:1761-7127(+)
MCSFERDGKGGFRDEEVTLRLRVDKGMGKKNPKLGRATLNLAEYTLIEHVEGGPKILPMRSQLSPKVIANLHIEVKTVIQKVDDKFVSATPPSSPSSSRSFLLSLDTRPLVTEPLLLSSPSTPPPSGIKPTPPTSPRPHPPTVLVVSPPRAPSPPVSPPSADPPNLAPTFSYTNIADTSTRLNPLTMKQPALNTPGDRTALPRGAVVPAFVPKKGPVPVPDSRRFAIKGTADESPLADQPNDPTLEGRPRSSAVDHRQSSMFQPLPDIGVRDTLEKEIKALQDELKTRNTEIVQVRAELKRSKSQLGAELAEKKQGNDNLSSELKTVRELLRTKTMDLAQARAALASSKVGHLEETQDAHDRDKERANTIKDLDAAKGNIASLRTQLTNAQAEIANTKRQHEDIVGKLKEELNMKRTAHDASLVESKHTHHRLGQAQTRCTELEAELEAMKKMNARKEGTTTDKLVKNKSEDWMSQKAKLEQENRDKAKQVQDAEQEIQALRSEVSKVAASSANFQERLRSAGLELNGAKGVQQKLQSENKKLKETVDRLTEQANEATKSTIDMQAQVDDLTSRLGTGRASRIAAQEAKTQLDATVVRHASEVAEMQSQHALALEQVNAIIDRIHVDYAARIKTAEDETEKTQRTYDQERNGYTHTVAQLNVDKDRLEAEAAQLHSLLQVSQEERSRLEQDRMKLDEENTRIMEQVSVESDRRLREESARLVATTLHADQASQLQEIIKQRDEERLMREGYEHRLGVAETERDVLKRKMAELHDTLASRDDDLRTSTHLYDEAVASCKEWEGRYTTLQATHNDLRKRVAELDAMGAQLEALTTTMAEVVQSSETKDKQIQDITKQLHEERTGHQDLLHRNKALQAQVAELTTDRERTATAMGRVNELTVSLEAKDQRLKEVERQRDEFTASSKDWERRYLIIETDRDTLKKQVAELRSESEHLEASSGSMAELTDQILVKDRELQQTERQYQAEMAARQDWERRCLLLETERDTIRTLVTTLQDRLDASISKEMEQTGLVEKMEERLHEATQQRDEVGVTCRDWVQRYNILEAQRDVLKRQVEDLTASAGHAEEAATKLTNLAELLDSKDDQIRKIEEQRNDETAAKKAAAHIVEQQKAEISTLRDTLSASQDQLKGLSDDLQAAHHQWSQRHSTLEAECDDLKRQIVELNGAVDNKEQQHREVMEVERDLLRTQVNGLLEAAEGAERQLQAIHQALEEETNSTHRLQNILEEKGEAHRTQVAQLSGAIEDKGRELRAAAQQHEKDIAALQATEHELKNGITAREELLVELQRRDEAALAVASELERSCRELQDQLERAQTDLAARENDRTEAHEAEIRQTREDALSARLESSELHAKIASLEEHVREQVSQHTSDMQLAQHDIARLKAELDEGRALHTAAESLHLAELEAARGHAEEARSCLETTARELSETESRLEQADQHIQVAKEDTLAKIQLIGEKDIEIQSKYSAIAELTKELKMTQVRLVHLQGVHNDTLGDVEQSNNALAAMKQQYSEMEQSLQAKDHALARAAREDEHRSGADDAKLATITKETQSLRDQLASSREKHNEIERILQGQLTESQSSCAVYERRVNELETKLNNLESASNLNLLLDRDLQSLLDDINKEEIVTRTEQVEEHATKMEKEREQIIHAVDEQLHAAHELAQFWETQVQAREAELAAAQADLIQRTSEVHWWKEHVTEKDQALASMQETLTNQAGLHEALEEMRQAGQTREKEAARRERTLASFQEALRDKQSECDQLRDSLKSLQTQLREFTQL